MPAAATDKFIKGARRWAGQIGASGVADGTVATIPLVSVTGLPTDTAVELTIDRVDANGTLTPSKEEVIRGVVNGLNIITSVRGVEGTAQGHSAGAVVEVRLTADQWNRHLDGILVEHNQDGSHHFESAPTLKEVTTPSNPAAGYRKLYMKSDGKVYKLNSAGLEEEVGAGNLAAAQNLLKNGNFINASSVGYGGLADDWLDSSSNSVQGGIPTLTKQELIDATGITTADIELLVNLNGNFNDLSDNGYNLTPSGSPTDSNDGLMAQAKDFEDGSSQHASNAAAPNTVIAGSQTWIIYVKPESIAGGVARLFGRAIAAGSGQANILFETGAIKFQLQGLTTNTEVASPVRPQAAKWYMIVGVYDSANSKLKIHVNGVKNEVTASGSATTAGTYSTSVGRSGLYAADYFDGLAQNAIMLSTALTDTQVKRLFAATMYKGVKVRRAGSNGYLYQDLATDVVERLRGKIVALRADIYQAVASTAQISLHQTLADGTTNETIISSTDATTGSWLEKYATGTISATAVAIQIRLKHSTSDGNSWFKKVSLYEGALLLPYDHSKDDWNRLPRLLMMDFPKVKSGYQYEEGRVFDSPFTPTYRGSGSLTYTSVTTSINKFMIRGKSITYWLSCTGTTGGTTSVALYFTQPFWIASAFTGGYNGHGLGLVNNSLQSSGIARQNGNDEVECYLYNGGNWTLGANVTIQDNGCTVAID